jgi:hypothetical protein
MMASTPVSCELIRKKELVWGEFNPKALKLVQWKETCNILAVRERILSHPSSTKTTLF